MKAMLYNWIPWVGGSLFAISGGVEVRVVSAMKLNQFSGPGYLAAGFGLAWIAFAVGRRVNKEADSLSCKPDEKSS
jgi:hypothetical protein